MIPSPIALHLSLDFYKNNSWGLCWLSPIYTWLFVIKIMERGPNCLTAVLISLRFLWRVFLAITISVCIFLENKNTTVVFITRDLYYSLKHRQTGLGLRVAIFCYYSTLFPRGSVHLYLLDIVFVSYISLRQRTFLEHLSHFDCTSNLTIYPHGEVFIPRLEARGGKRPEYSMQHVNLY